MERGTGRPVRCDVPFPGGVAIMFPPSERRRVAALFLLATVPAAAPAAEPALTAPKPKIVRPLPAAPGDAGDFILSLCEGPGGEIWVGSEDRGVLRFVPNDDGQGDDGGTWTRFTTRHGLGDANGHALAVDGTGRVWAGLRSHGVATFNGRLWRTYGRLHGPIGERVHDLSVSPTDGSVTLATDAGLSRYDVREDRWSPAPPLWDRSGMSRQAFALSHAADGTLFVGTACDGVSVLPATLPATSANASPFRRGRVRHPLKAELEPTGPGLPSVQINDVLAHSSGTVYAATVRGLAESDDGGATWRYTRGRDYADKVRGRTGGPPPAWEPATDAEAAQLLPEDYVTCLAEDADGRLWVGFRRRGLLVRDLESGRTLEVPPGDGLEEGFVTAILPRPDGNPWVGTYGGGLLRPDFAERLPGVFKNNPALSEPPAPRRRGRPPSPLAPPSAYLLRQEIAAYWQALDNEQGPSTFGCHLGADWQTGGDWVGRYGRQGAMLCAASSPLDHSFNMAFTEYGVDGLLGPHAREGDSRRMWLHELRWEDPRVLYDPIVGYRRQGNWVDNGQAYPLTHEGPDLWIAADVPAGMHRVSLYFFNKDGHKAKNRWRDYLLELRTGGDLDPPPKRRMPEGAGEATRVLATARVKDFWGGVYHRFAVRGPGRYHVRVARNDSYNTEVVGVFLDRLSGPPTDKEAAHPNLGWGFDEKEYGPPPPPPIAGLPEPQASAAALARLLEERVSPNRVRDVERLRLIALRAIRAAPASPDAVRYLRERRLGLSRRGFVSDIAPQPPEEDWATRLRWRLPLWTEADRAAFAAAMRQAFVVHARRNPHRRDPPPARPADPMD